MNRLMLLYVDLCKQYGPEGLTYSAYAWKLHLEGRSYWRNRIDGGALLFFGQADHCEAQFQRETAQQPRP